MKVDVDRLRREGWKMVGAHTSQYAAYKQRCNRKDHKVVLDLMAGCWKVYCAPRKG